MAATDGPAHAGASAASDSLPDVASFVDQAAALLMEFPVAVDVEQASVYTLGDPNDDH
jgi:hypothetical protein